MEASHKTHRPHIKVGKDDEEEDIGKSVIESNIHIEVNEFFTHFGGSCY